MRLSERDTERETLYFSVVIFMSYNYIVKMIQPVLAAVWKIKCARCCYSAILLTVIGVVYFGAHLLLVGFCSHLLTIC